MLPPSAVADLERELGQALEQIQRDPTRDHGRAYRRRTGDTPPVPGRPTGDGQATTARSTGENRRQAGCPGENQETETGDGPATTGRPTGDIGA
jgi:hypothetical protein